MFSFTVIFPFFGFTLLSACGVHPFMVEVMNAKVDSLYSQNAAKNTDFSKAVYTYTKQTANKCIHLFKMGICGQYSKSERAMANAFVRIW